MWAFCVKKTVWETVFSKKVRGFVIRAVKIFALQMFSVPLGYAKTKNSRTKCGCFFVL